MHNENIGIGEEQVQELSSTQETSQGADKKTFKIPVKTAIIVVVVIGVGILAYVYKGLFIAASVDGSLISRVSIIERLERTSGKNVLDSLITEKLIENEAKAKGVSVSDDEVSEEINKITEQVKQQGGTLDEALVAQGMTVDDLKKNIALQKKVEKLVADKVGVTDEEVAQYIADNKIEITPGQEAQTSSEIKEGLKNQKLSIEANSLITQLKEKAKIKYFANY